MIIIKITMDYDMPFPSSKTPTCKTRLNEKPFL